MRRVLMTGRWGFEHFISSHFMFLFFAMCFVVMQQQVGSLLYLSLISNGG